MKNTYGTSVSVTLFGESHGAAVGAVLDGMAPGVRVDEDCIRHQLTLRRPSGAISTARRESDKFQIISGVYNGYTTGTPLCILIPNRDVNSEDYEKTAFLARPGHADHTAWEKFHGYEDPRGGGHFSGRLTSALVAVGAIAISALQNKGIVIGTHIKCCAGVEDDGFQDYKIDLPLLNEKPFAVLNETKGEEMRQKIEAAAEENDSVGGILETAVTGFPAGVGEPWFDTVESVLSHALFSVPAVKGVEFGDGFGFALNKGSAANDPLRMENGRIISKTNHNGGVIGGISNGMPILFRCAVKPTPSIAKSQQTVDLLKKQNAEILISGRHDPAIIHRARVVVDSVTALVLCDLLALRYGTDYLGGRN